MNTYQWILLHLVQGQGQEGPKWSRCCHKARCESNSKGGHGKFHRVPLKMIILSNYRHPGPRRMWDGGSEPQFLPPLPSLPRLRWRVPKTLKLLLYASLQSSQPPATLSCCVLALELVRVAALPRRREHRENNFRQKNI